MQQKLAQFLYDLLAVSGTVVWAHRVETILKSCSANNETVSFTARVSVKFFEGLVTLGDCVNRTVATNLARNPRARTNHARFLADRCAGMVDILTTCLKYKESASIIAQALFPTIQRKFCLLHNDRIGELFCGTGNDYNLQAITTLQLLMNRAENLQVEQRVLAICTSPAVVKHFEGVMRESTSKRLIRMTYALAINVQE